MTFKVRITKPVAYVKPRPIATGVLLIGSAYGFYKASRAAGKWFDRFAESVDSAVATAQVAATVIRNNDEDEDE